MVNSEEASKGFLRLLLPLVSATVFSFGGFLAPTFIPLMNQRSGSMNGVKGLMRGLWIPSALGSEREDLENGTGEESKLKVSKKKSSKSLSLPVNREDKNKVLMLEARHLYEKNQLAKAVDIYSKVETGSDFWLEALEERAWANTKMGDYEKALADLKSITSSVWASQVGPETYMLSAFVSLKTCSYKDVVKKISLFKERMKPRVQALEGILKGTLPEKSGNIFEQIRSGSLNMSTLGSQAENYPRFFFRDYQVKKYVQSHRDDLLKMRLKELASEDIREIREKLRKMKIIDVQVIQDLFAKDEVKQTKKKLKFSKVDRDEKMTFPVSDSDDEVWIDEVGQFQVKTNKCPHQIPTAQGGA